MKIWFSTQWTSRLMPWMGWNRVRGGLNFQSTDFVETWVKWQLYLRPIWVTIYAVSSIFQRLFSVSPVFVHQRSIWENSCSEISFVLRCKFQSKCVASNHHIQCICFFTWKKLISTLLPSLSFLLRQIEIKTNLTALRKRKFLRWFPNKRTRHRFPMKLGMTSLQYIRC